MKIKSLRQFNSNQIKPSIKVSLSPERQMQMQDQMYSLNKDIARQKRRNRELTNSKKRSDAKIVEQNNLKVKKVKTMN